MTIPNSTPRWPLPEHRSAEQLASDSAAVAGQVRVLTPARSTATPPPEPATARILLRCSRVADGNRFVSSAATATTEPVVVAENQLVVRAADTALPALGGVLPGGYTWRRRAGQTAQVLQFPGRSLADLQNDIARLRSRNIVANVNMVLPLGQQYVVKADSYPALTTGPGPFPAGRIDPTIRVAVIDTGRSAENRADAWFTGVVPTGTDPLNEVAPLDRNDWFAGHGTFTAGIVRQVAPSCQVQVYRFTGPDGLGTDDAAADMFVRAADDAAHDGCRLVINASFGAPAVAGVPPLALQSAIEYIAAHYPEVLIVASAGNDGVDERVYPAAFGDLGVKAVGALDADLRPAPFSNFGDWVDCSTVGVGVVSTYVQGKLPPEPGLGTDVDFPADAWAAWSGTSFTAPQISAAVAQLCSETPTLSPRAAFDTLLAPRDLLAGYGKVVHLLRGTP